MTNQAPPAVPEVESWSVSDLELDPENPRLPEDLTDRSEPSLLRYFEENYDLEELGWSMAQRGYFAEEPLLTIYDPDDSTKRLVIEGNRRLATLKLLLDSSAREHVGKKIWHELAELCEHDLSAVPTRNYESRRSLLEYMGFRHVSGLLAWTADAKARFVHKLIVEYGYKFDKAARVIGSRSDAIRRQFIAWSALEQARSTGEDVSPAVQHFGVFYRALQNPRIREFIRLQGWGDGTEETRSPLVDDGHERLGELLTFVFGKTRVLKESRQLDDLARVLDDKHALALLRDERDLSLALQELPGDRDALYAAIRLAYRHAARANAEAWRFAGDGELQEEADRLAEIATRIVQSLEPASPTTEAGEN